MRLNYWHESCPIFKYYKILLSYGSSGFKRTQENTYQEIGVISIIIIVPLLIILFLKSVFIPGVSLSQV